MSKCEFLLSMKTINILHGDMSVSADTRREGHAQSENRKADVSVENESFQGFIQRGNSCEDAVQSE